MIIPLPVQVLPINKYNMIPYLFSGITGQFQFMQNLMQVYSEQGAHARQKHQRLGAIWQVQEIAMQNQVMTRQMQMGALMSQSLRFFLYPEQVHGTSASANTQLIQPKQSVLQLQPEVNVWLLQVSIRLQMFPQVRSDSGPASISSPTLTMQLAPSSMFVSPLLTRHTASDCQMNLQKKMKSVWCQLQ